jgi:hypothetical protein
MFKYKKYLFLTLFIISSSIFNDARANTIIKCSGVKTTVNAMLRVPEVKSFIEFTISENNGFLVIIGANIPVYRFPITLRADDALGSMVKDTQNYDWLVNFYRYSGEIYIYRSSVNTIYHNVMVQIMIKGNCKKHEKLM